MPRAQLLRMIRRNSKNFHVQRAVLGEPASIHGDIARFDGEHGELFEFDRRGCMRDVETGQRLEPLEALACALGITLPGNLSELARTIAAVLEVVT